MNDNEDQFEYATLYRHPGAELYLGTLDPDLRELCITTTQNPSPMKEMTLFKALNDLADKGWHFFAEVQAGEQFRGHTLPTILLRHKRRIKRRSGKVGDGDTAI